MMEWTQGDRFPEWRPEPRGPGGRRSSLAISPARRSGPAPGREPHPRRRGGKQASSRSRRGPREPAQSRERLAVESLLLLFIHGQGVARVDPQVTHGAVRALPEPEHRTVVLALEQIAQRVGLEAPHARVVGSSHKEIHHIEWRALRGRARLVGFHCRERVLEARLVIVLRPKMPTRAVDSGAGAEVSRRRRPCAIGRPERRSPCHLPARESGRRR
jgi:hypothetical protein